MLMLKAKETQKSARKGQIYTVRVSSGNESTALGATETKLNESARS